VGLVAFALAASAFADCGAAVAGTSSGNPTTAAAASPRVSSKPPTTIVAQSSGISSSDGVKLRAPKFELQSAESKPTPTASGGSVREYLWSVYRRSSLKSDSHGDFTWKDETAAARSGLSMEDYVIGGMDPDFREQLFAVGQAMDAAGVPWTILSGFRDDYRQGIASGMKAGTGNSFHGGSVRTGGYGHGCAVDLASIDRLVDDAVWNWIDKHGRQFGLYRPLRAADPAHTEPAEGWRELAAALREKRLATPSAAPETAENKVERSTLDSGDDDSADYGATELQVSCSRARVMQMMYQAQKPGSDQHAGKLAGGAKPGGADLRSKNADRHPPHPASKPQSGQTKRNDPARPHAQASDSHSL
jgi:hypothetical protein